MHPIRTFFWPQFPPSEDMLHGARLRLVHIMSLASAILSIVYAWSELAFHDHSEPARILSTALFFVAPLIYVVMAYQVSKGRYLRTCSYLLLAFYYILTLAMRIDTGAFTPGAVYFMALPMLAGMLIGVRAGVTSIFIVIATYVGLLAFRHYLPPPSRIVNGDDVAWQSAISFSLLSAACTGSALMFMSVMDRVIRDIRATNSELEAYKINLERLVEDRTRTIQSQSTELADALEAQKQANILQNTLVSVVSHEIRTPLAIIDGSARRMEQYPERLSKDDIRSRAGTIRQSVKRLIRLVERTLESARYAEGAITMQPQQFDLKSLLTEISDREQERTQFHAVRAQITDLPDTFFGDPNLLDHVFSNILANAIKYAPDNPRIDLVGETTDSGIIIKIKDYGVGIPAEELTRVSHRFFRASTSSGFSGTGVGLFLTRRITEDHGGTITIDSEEGRWTEVSVTLPFQEPAPKTPGIERAA